MIASWHISILESSIMIPVGEIPPTNQNHGTLYFSFENNFLAFFEIYFVIDFYALSSFACW